MKSLGTYQLATAWFVVAAVGLASCGSRSDATAEGETADERKTAHAEPLVSRGETVAGEKSEASAGRAGSQGTTTKGAVTNGAAATGKLSAAGDNSATLPTAARAAEAVATADKSAGAPSTKGNAAHSGEGTTQLWALVVGTAQDGKTFGKCNRLKVTVARHGASAFRVGFFESEVGGSGPDWRAAGWMASMVAGQSHDFDPSTTQVSFDVAGMIDGPSAGALMTVGVLAVLRGDEVRQDAAMTGTITPDGAIGAVGGIAHKIAGAAEAGKKLVLIPAGIRRQTDGNLGRLVDLIEVGEQLGIEVRPVTDVFQAYELLTGKSLPRPADLGHPTISEAAYEVLRPKVDEWLTRHHVMVEEYNNLPEDQRYEYPDGRIEESNTLAEAARRLLVEGQMAGAARSALMASVSAVMGLEVAKVNAVANERGMEEAKKLAKSATGAWAKLDLLVEQLRDVQPATVAEAGWLIDAFVSAAEGYAFCILADRLIEKPAENDDAVRENVLAAAGYYQLALLDIQLSQDSIQLGKSQTGPAFPSDARMQVAAGFFQHAADANLNVLKTSVIDQVAASLEIRPEALQAGLMANDERFALIRTIVDDVTPVLVNRLGDTPAAQFVRLAAATYAYGGVSGLIAKYGSLDAKLENFEVVSVPKEKTLQNMLDTAEEQARRAIHRLQAAGIDASSAVLGYELARLQRDRELGERLEALENYWNIYIHAQVVAKLAGLRAGE